MGYVGNVQATGVADPNNRLLAGGWTVTFDPNVTGWHNAVEVFHIAVQGPLVSLFHVYLNTTFYDAVFGGGANSWDPSQPLFMPIGSTLYFYYNTVTTPAPVISIFGREPRISDQI